MQLKQKQMAENRSKGLGPNLSCAGPAMMLAASIQKDWNEPIQLIVESDVEGITTCL